MGLNNQPTNSPIPSPSQFYPWRTSPSISPTCQQYLTDCLATKPDIQQGTYPFKDIKLTRPDIEWLLAMHEDGRGPVDWSDEQQRERMGLDLRGADLRHVNLSGLPLARMYGGLTWEEWILTTPEQRHLADVHLEGADLSEAHLEGAILRGAYLEGATLRGAYLQEAVLYRAHLSGAYLRRAHLEKANLRGADLRGVYLRNAGLAGADLRDSFFNAETDIEGVVLGDEKFGYVSLADVHWGQGFSKVEREGRERAKERSKKSPDREKKREKEAGLS